MAALSIRMTVVTAACLVAFAAPAQTPVDARAVVENGSAGGAPACVACHGLNGEGNADSGFPRLGGLDKAYMARQLDALADGRRKNDVMSPVAAALTPAERAALAAYYAAAAPAPAPPAEVDAALGAVGERIASRGGGQKGLPACASCHGPHGEGVGGTFPRLAGQPASYLRAQLTAWREGGRAGEPLDLMKTVAGKLDEAEIEAVAAYYAAFSTPSGEQP